jgi:hypothetical protein
LSVRAISTKMDETQPNGSVHDITAGVRRLPWRSYSQELDSRGGWALSSSPNQRRPASKKTLSTGIGRQRSATETDYDRWLDRRLHQLYDPVLNEDIPEEMMKLLMRFEERPPQEEDDRN